MLYARDIVELMGAYPGREFRMVHIVRYVSQGKQLALKERRAVRKAVQRALEAFAEAGSVRKNPPTASRGAPVFYVWKSET